MKLCRFELLTDPGVPRSGIYHDGRFYETDGEKAVGIHDPGQIRLLAPTGLPPAVRLFDTFHALDGSPRLSYSYMHPGRLKPPASELDTTGSESSLDFDVRLTALILEGDPTKGPSEAARMLLGFGILIVLFNSDEREELVSSNASPAPALDLPASFGPFLITPDELTDNRTTDDPTEYSWSTKISINGELVHQAITPPDYSLFDLLSIASRKTPVLPGEVLAWPAISKPSLESTTFGRFLVPTDKISVEVDPIGTLVSRII